jgi:hypothetical protein
VEKCSFTTKKYKSCDWATENIKISKHMESEFFLTDITFCVLRHINDGKTFKNCLLVSKSFEKILGELFPKYYYVITSLLY